MRIIFTIILPILLPVIVLAQDSIETDRPSETQNASIVSKGSFQAEIGFRKQHQEGEQYIYRHPNAVFRYGLLPFLELRLEPNFETAQFTSPNKSQHGLEPLEVGIKARLFQNEDTSFIFSVFGNIGIPKLASEDYQLNKAFYRTRLLFQNKLGEKVKFNYNVGSDWDNEDMQQNWMYSISPQYEISNKWTILMEEYANFQANSASAHYADIGVIFGITNKVQLDINAGKGLNKSADDYFVSAGFSFKL